MEASNRNGSELAFAIREVNIIAKFAANMHSQTLLDITNFAFAGFAAALEIEEPNSRLGISAPSYKRLSLCHCFRPLKLV